MKKILVSLILCLTMALSVLTVSANAEAVGTPGVDMPSIDALDSLVIGRTTLYGFGMNGGKFIHDYNYGGIWDITNNGGYDIAFEVIDPNSQKPPYAAVGANATQSCPIGVTGVSNFGKDGKVGPININNETGKSDSKYVGAWQFNIGGSGEMKSFCFATSAAGTFYESPLNGFDLYIGDDPFNVPKVETDEATGTSKVVGEANPTYKLAYHADFLAETGLWQLAADKSFSYFEADFDKPMEGSYVVLAVSEDNLKTTKNYTTTDAEGKTTSYPVFVISEIAIFDRGLKESASTEATTAAPITDPVSTSPVSTDAPGTDAPGTDGQGTDAPVTDAPVITASPGNEKKTDEKGCKGSIALVSVSVLILGTAIIRKKEN